MPTSPLLRVSLIVLLVLGMLIRPMLNQIGELHGLEHQLQASAHNHININTDKPSTKPFQGSHQLQHSAEPGSSASLLPFLGILEFGLLPQVVAASHPTRSLPIPPLSFHYRPPIL